MTYDLLYTFKNYFKDNKVVLDTYKMQDGIYFLVKKDDTIEKLIVEKGEPDNSELYEYLKEKDFYSKCLNSNKALDTKYEEKIDNVKYNTMKKIFSNNIYTLFFKNESCTDFTNDLKSEAIPTNIFEKGIIKYYESLKNLGKSKEVIGIINDGYTDEEIEIYKEKMIYIFKTIGKKLTDEEKLKKATWIKVFIDNSNEEYERVSNFYIRTKLFNTNKNNIKQNGDIFGANNYNFGCNSKKPYLELKTTPFKVGSLVSIRDIDVMNKIYLWLYNNGINESVLKLPVDWEFKGIPQSEQNISNKDLFILKVNGNNGVAKIEDFDYKSSFNTEIRPFTCKDYMRHKENDFTTSNIYGLEWYTNNTWISNTSKDNKRNYIRESYYDFEKKKILKSLIANWKKELLQKYSQAFFYLFQREERNIFLQNLDNIASEVVERTLVDDLNLGIKFTNNSKRAMNLWIAFKDYFNEKGESEEMKLNNIQEKCKNIVLEGNNIETDEEYYFLMGQVAYYLLSRSKASKLTQDVTEPFIKAANITVLKKELRDLYEKYNYDIYLKDKRFNNVFSQILVQEPESEVRKNKNIILAGMLSNNLFYNGGIKDDE